MLVQFNQLVYDAENLVEHPDIELYSQDETLLGVLGDAYNISVKLNYNDVSEINFTLPCESPFYNTVRGNLYVAMPSFGKFILINPKRTTDGIRDVLECTAFSREYEFNHTQFYISDGTYNLFNPADSTNTLVSTLMRYMPGWSLGSVDVSLYNRYRTFDTNTTGLYDFMMNVVQPAYGVYFVFDNINRKVYIHDASVAKSTVPVYLSLDNLIKSVSVQEDTEGVVTCMDVYGADGVDIRSANPTGTNKIYKLDYYMSQPDVSPTLKSKWEAWQSNLANHQELYYNITVSRNMATAAYLSEQAKLVELQAELASFQGVRSAIIEGIAAGLKTNSDLAVINASISSKEGEIARQQSVLDGYLSSGADYASQLAAINEATAFSQFFTAEELILLKNYIKETSLQDTTFVSTSIQSYNTPNTTKKIESGQIQISGGAVTTTQSAGKTIYDITGGRITVSGYELSISATVVHAVVQVDSTGYVLSAYLAETSAQGDTYLSGTVTSNGSASVSPLSGGLSMTVSGANVYFTSNVTEYQTRYVEYELYKFAEQTLKKLSEPSYTFEIDSLNFLFAKEFEPFKDALELGSAMYLEIDEGYVLNPILLSVEYQYESPESLKLVFSNKYRLSGKEFRMMDIINDMSYSTKSLDFNKYNYADFVSSGAESQIKKFINSALDTSKNAIISGENMGVYMDGNGLHLCKKNDDGIGYHPEQIHMINNNIVFTQDNLETVSIAIGRFYDENAGDSMGIVAPSIVGTLLAGRACIIESEKQYGGIAQFKVDENGVSINNAKLTLTSDGTTKTQSVLDPRVGFAVGVYPLYETNPETDDLTLKEENARLYFDNSTGNLVLKGTVYAEDGVFRGKVYAIDGEFEGKVTATSGQFKGIVQASQFLDSNGNNMLSNNQFKGDYLNLKGISVTNGGVTTFRVDGSGNVSMSGNITMNGGSINWNSVGSDPKIQAAQNTANNAQSAADTAHSNAMSSYNNLIALANGTFNIGTTFISGKRIQSPEIYAAQIYGGEISSGTTINVGTDARIGNNLIMMNTTSGTTGAIKFGTGSDWDTPSIQLEKSNWAYGVPVLSMNAPQSNSFIEISTGTRVLGSYNATYVSGDIIIRANNNIRLGTPSHGNVFINGNSFRYDSGVLYINGQAYGGGGGGGTAVFG